MPAVTDGAPSQTARQGRRVHRPASRSRVQCAKTGGTKCRSNILSLGLALTLPIAGCSTRALSPLPQTEILTGSKLKQADTDFVTAAYQIVQLDDQEGQLSGTRAADPRVRALAVQLASQANMLYPQLQDTIKSNGISAPNRLPLALSGQVDKLKGLTGSAFDRQYVADQVQSHQRAVDIFQKEASTTEDPAMRTQAQTALPVVQDNLGRLKFLAGDLK